MVATSMIYCRGVWPLLAYLRVEPTRRFPVLCGPLTAVQRQE